MKRMDIYTNFYVIWKSASLEIADCTTLCSNFLRSQLSETLTFEANIFHFLSKPLYCKPLYQFPHLTGKDFSKAINNFNTEHNSA